MAFWDNWFSTSATTEPLPEETPVEPDASYDTYFEPKLTDTPTPAWNDPAWDQNAWDSPVWGTTPDPGTYEPEPQEPLAPLTVDTYDPYTSAPQNYEEPPPLPPVVEDIPPSAPVVSADDYGNDATVVEYSTDYIAEIPEIVRTAAGIAHDLSPEGIGESIGRTMREAWDPSAQTGENLITVAMGVAGDVAGNVINRIAPAPTPAEAELEIVDPNGWIKKADELGYDEHTLVGQAIRKNLDPSASGVAKIGSSLMAVVDVLGEPARQVEEVIGIASAYIPKNKDDEGWSELGKYSTSLGFVGELAKMNIPVAVGQGIGRLVAGTAPKTSAPQRSLADVASEAVAYANEKGYAVPESQNQRMQTRDAASSPIQDAYKAVTGRTGYVIAETAKRGYSDIKSQEEIAVRIALGENPDVARAGATAPKKNAFLSDKENWAALVHNRIEVVGRIAEFEGSKLGLTKEDIDFRVKKAKEEEALSIARTDSIRGSENIFAEMLGGIVLDPMNFVGGIGLFDDAIKRATGQKLAADLLKPQFAGPLAKGEEVIANADVLIEQATKGMPERWVMAANEIKTQGQALKQAGKTSAINDLLETGIDVVDAIIGNTPGTQAAVRADMATSTLIQLALPQNADDAVEVVSYISQLTNRNKELWDGSKLVGEVFGDSLTNSAKWKAASEVFNVAYPDLIKAASEAQTLDGFAYQKFLNASYDILEQAAKTLVPGAIEPTNKFMQARELAASVIRTEKAILSKVFLNNPSAVIRNAGGDVFGMAVDDLIRQHGGMSAKDYIEKFGGTQRVVDDGSSKIAAKYSFAGEAKVNGSTLVHKLTNAIMERGQKFEQARYQHAFIAAHEQFMAKNLNYAIADSVRVGVPEDVIQRLLKRASETSFSPKGLADEIRSLGKDIYVAPSVSELAGMAADEIRKSLGAGDVVEIRETYNRLVKEGKTKDDIAKALDDLASARSNRTKLSAAANGVSTAPVESHTVTASNDINRAVSDVVSAAKANGVDPAEAAQLANIASNARQATHDSLTATMDLARSQNGDIAAKVFNAILDEESVHYDEYYKAQFLAHEKAINHAGDSASKSLAWKKYYQEVSQLSDDLKKNIASVHQTYSDMLRVGDVNAIPESKNAFLKSYSEMIDELRGLGDAANGDVRSTLLSGRSAIMEARSALVDEASKLAKEIGDLQFSSRAYGHIRQAEIDSQKIFDAASGQREIINLRVANQYISIDDANKARGEIWRNAFRDSYNRNLVAREAVISESILFKDWAAELTKLGYPNEIIAKYKQGISLGTSGPDITRIVKNKVNYLQASDYSYYVAHTPAGRKLAINNAAIKRGNSVIERNGIPVMDERRVLNSLNAGREPYAPMFVSIDEAYGSRFDEAIKVLEKDREHYAQADYLRRQLPTLSKEAESARIELEPAEAGLKALIAKRSEFATGTAEAIEYDRQIQKATDKISAIKSILSQPEKITAEIARLDKLADAPGVLSVKEFERQLATSFRLPKEEVDASIALIKARAEAKGLTYEEYVAKTFAGVRKSEERNVIKALERNGVPTWEIKYGDGKVALTPKSKISADELQSLKDLGTEIIDHPKGVFEYDGIIAPQMLYQYAGEKANLTKTQSQNLAIAKLMVKEKKTQEQIREATGWFLGADKKLRYEIADIRGSPIVEKLPKGPIPRKGTSVTLGEIYDHPDLYAAYPQLKDRKIKFMPPRNDGLMGSSGDDAITIYIARADRLEEGKFSFIDTLTHEIQHDIQHIEGFATGGSEAALAGYMDNLLEEYDAALENTLKKSFISVRDWESGRLSGEEKIIAESAIKKDKELKRLDKRIEEYNRKSGGDAYRAYYVMAGEVEARDVSRRALFDLKTLKDVEPYSIENLAFNKQLVLGVGDGSESREIARGAVTFRADDGKAIIYAFKQPNVETVAHELGHIFRRDLTDDQLRVASKWAGVADGGVWNTAAEEKFAKGFTEFLRMGEAPTQELKSVFQKFRDWITAIWKNLAGDSIPAEMKTLYKEMLSPMVKIPEGVLPSPVAAVASTVDIRIAEARMKNAMELLTKHPDNPAIAHEFDKAKKALEAANASSRVSAIQDDIADLTKASSPLDIGRYDVKKEDLQAAVDDLLSKGNVKVSAKSEVDDLANEYLKKNIAAQTKGAGSPPQPHEIEAASEAEFNRVIGKIKSRLGTDISIPSPAVANWDQTSNKIANHLQVQWNDLNARAIADAEARANFSLLDYTKHRGFDIIPQVIAPYSYWFTRQARNYTVRLLQDPEILMHWLRYDNYKEKQNQARNGPSGIKGKYNLNELSGGRITGTVANQLYFDPLSGFIPLGDIFRTNYNDPERERTSAQTLYDVTGLLGVSPNPFLDAAIRGSGALVETKDASGAELSKEEIEKQSSVYGAESLGYYWQFGGALLGATALSGMNNGTGLDMERAIYKALGVQTRAQDSKRISAGISAVSFEQQKNPGYDPRYGVLAQAIHERNKDSYTKIDDLVFGNSLELSKRLASELGSSRKDAEIALYIFRDGVARAAKERGGSRLFSWTTGMSSSILTEGAKNQRTAAALEKGAKYNSATETGSRANLEIVRKMNPASEVARAQFATYPGDKKDPVDQWEWMEKQRITTEFGALKDAFIRKNPADFKGAKAIDDAMWKEWNKIGADLDTVQTTTTPIPAEGWELSLSQMKQKLTAGEKIPAPTSATVAYAPKSIYGASPEEIIEIRKNEILKSYSEKRPSPSDFIDSLGDINHKAYADSLASWEKNVREKILQDKTTSLVLAQAAKDGGDTEKALNIWLAGSLDADLKSYKARYDSPLEAMQAAWNKKYSALYEQYNDQKKGDKDAFQKTVGSLGSMTDKELIKLVKDTYPGLFSDTYIEEQLKGVTMPSALEFGKINMSKDKRAIEDSLTRLDEALKNKIPGGRLTTELMKENPLVAGVLAAKYDSKMKERLTPEMIAQAEIIVNGFASANRIQANPVEWEQARLMMKSHKDSMLAKYGDGWEKKMADYYNADTKTRASMVAGSSSLAGLLKDYAVIRANPLYQKYYAEQTQQSSKLESPSASSGSIGTKSVSSSVAKEFWDAYGNIPAAQRSAMIKANPMLGKLINPETRASVSEDMWKNLTGLVKGKYSNSEFMAIVEKNQTEKQAQSQFWEQYQKLSPQAKRAVFTAPQVLKVVNSETRAGATKEDYQVAYRIINSAITAPSQAPAKQASPSQPQQPLAAKPVQAQAPRQINNPAAKQVSTVKPTAKPAPVVKPAVITRDNPLPDAFWGMYKSIPASTLAKMIVDRPVIAAATKENAGTVAYARAIAAMEKWVPTQPRSSGKSGGSYSGGGKGLASKRPPRGKRGPKTNKPKSNSPQNKTVISPYNN